MTTDIVILTTMDDLDTRLISLLRTNARMTLAELSRRLEVPRGTANFRLQRLERNGTIQGYTLRLHSDQELRMIHAWATLRVHGAKLTAIVQRLLGDPCVTVVHDTTGHWDLLVELEVSSLEQLAKVLDRILLIPGIKSSETSVHLSTYR